MNDPMKLTIKDIAAMIDKCSKKGVACHIEFVPMRKEEKADE